MTEKEQYINLAEVSLLRTGLVRIIPHGKDLDFLAYFIHDPEKLIGVEVKAITYSEGDAIQKLNSVKDKISALQSQKRIPIILFLIDTQKGDGFFTMFDENESQEVIPLNLDILLRKVAVALNVAVPQEYPPYKFYHKGSHNKYETAPIAVNDHFAVLRLKNIVIYPMDAKKDLRLEILISGETSSDTGYKTYIHKLNGLYENEKIRNYLFFVQGDIPFIDHQLPTGHKTITFKLKSDNPIKEFDCSLSCEYLTEAQSKLLPF